MSVGTGSIKRAAAAAKTLDETAKTGLSEDKSVKESAETVANSAQEAAAGGGIEAVAAEVSEENGKKAQAKNTAVKKTTAKKSASQKSTTEKATTQKTTAKKASLAEETKEQSAKEEKSERQAVLEQGEFCHLTEELPIHLL